MKHRSLTTAALAAALSVSLIGVAGAHPEDSADGGLHAPDVDDGHVEANVNYGFQAVGHSPLSGVQDGRYTDVWTHAGHAYVGSFQDPDCSRAGVYIADLADPTAPEYIGQIKSPPSTRVNDVKVTDVGDRDVLIFSLEKCGDLVGANSNQKGQGGISLWDVTDPSNPHALKQNFLDFQVHNTYPWTTEDGGTYALVVDDENIDDLHVVDLTKPQSPKLIATTGIGSWLADPVIAADLGDELFLGTFAASLLHDVWVEKNPSTGRWEGVLSYWDAGFITVDLTDPSNPTFIADSDYLDQDPILAEERAAFGGRPEGNAHAAVFGGDDNEFIFGGDEDFDARAITIAQQGGPSFAANNGSDTPTPTAEGLSGPLTFVGLACGEAIPAAGSADAIALIERGACAFTTKATEVTAAGYSAGIVFNRTGPDVSCETGIGMLVAGDIPMVSISRADGWSLMGAACDPADDDAPTPAELVGQTFSPVTLSSAFVGWGYFWVLNNSGGTVDGVNALGSRMMAETTSVDPMGTMGYYAPAEIADPALAEDAGDLTMHNLETDVVEDGRDRSFISWYSLGMRAVEYRNGHYHDNSNGEGSYSWNVHEVGRWIADEAADEQFGTGNGDLVGSNFWGVTQYVDEDGTRYVVGSDRNTGLWVFEWECVGRQGDAGNENLYCNP